MGWGGAAGRGTGEGLGGRRAGAGHTIFGQLEGAFNNRLHGDADPLQREGGGGGGSLGGNCFRPPLLFH